MQDGHSQRGHLSTSGDFHIQTKDVKKEICPSSHFAITHGGIIVYPDLFVCFCLFVCSGLSKQFLSACIVFSVSAWTNINYMFMSTRGKCIATYFALFLPQQCGGTITCPSYICNNQNGSSCFSVTEWSNRDLVKKFSWGPRYLNVLVLVNTGTLLV